MYRNKEIIDIFKKYRKGQSLYTSDNKVIIDRQFGSRPSKTEP